MMNPFTIDADDYDSLWLLGIIVGLGSCIVFNVHALAPEETVALVPYLNDPQVTFYTAISSMIYTWATTLAVVGPIIALMAKKNWIHESWFTTFGLVLIFGLPMYISLSAVLGLLSMHLFTFLVSVVAEINPAENLKNLYTKLQEHGS